ncbi:MBL fold metallo-hydrolase [Methanoregula formicica]|uniref:Metal-dependent hydrolase, beta-lactamase superfamily II n=1 Tax=Methanoregula formicica (strain DSM 22288 / NBRC 105244 / SMSP) TaxID=593750 RepID=L0HCN4_METFS|nr:MBL fold metallo-hydrolase [Methanoregula formicica]AGB01770.1 metal-dependent hydrolase, beta-lactamase superfamily II [Methanoregula formicica SMSP]
MTEHKLKPADRVEITVLVDNYTDVLMNTSSTPVDRRLPYNPDRHILAEHGLSCLVKVFSRKKEHAILLDAGLSAECLPRNACQMRISLAGIEAVVLSHGHYDHTGALDCVVSGAGRQIPLIAHPDAFLPRRRNVPGKGIFNQRFPDAVALKRAGADIRMRSGPSTLAAGHLLVTGEVERKTSFEKGVTGAEIERDGKWVADLLRDDQALVMSVKDKGLVVLSGCAHAGIINTVEYAKKITGTDHVHAVLGGFHLSGKVYEQVVPPTIEAMTQINPQYIVPMHCTGWSTINRFMTAMTGKCILNTLGTTYVF